MKRSHHIIQAKTDPILYIHHTKTVLESKILYVRYFLERFEREREGERERGKDNGEKLGRTWLCEGCAEWRQNCDYGKNEKTKRTSTGDYVDPGFDRGSQVGDSRWCI
jgi:hypothetical protein